MKYFLVLFIGVFACSISKAQSIKGKVVNDENQPINTAYIYNTNSGSHTHSKSDGQNHIPLAPKFTAIGGLSVNNLNDFSGGLRMRYLGDRPANEDNYIVAEGYFVTDLNLNYNLNKNISVGVVVENLFDVEWNETQFATESRLATEVDAVEEIHFTPGTPFFIRGSISYKF